jgi:hypothetical protein
MREIFPDEQAETKEINFFSLKQLSSDKISPVYPLIEILYSKTIFAFNSLLVIFKF